MDTLSIAAEDLRPGDIILQPRVIVERVTLGETHVRVFMVNGYPGMYRRDDRVSIERAKEVAS